MKEVFWVLGKTTPFSKILHPMFPFDPENNKPVSLTQKQKTSSPSMTH
jgi:hypothetical protein